MPAPKKVAAVVTEYRKWSHADVIVGKILEGYNYDGGAGPNLEVAAMYVDQSPKNDMSRDLAKKYHFPLTETIEAALTLGGKPLAVAGVKAVQCLQGEAMWQALDAGRWSKPLLEAAMERVPAHLKGDYRAPTAKNASAAVYLIEYRDGFRAAVAMLNGWVQEGDGGSF